MECGKNRNTGIAEHQKHQNTGTANQKQLKKSGIGSKNPEQLLKSKFLIFHPFLRFGRHSRDVLRHLQQFVLKAFDVTSICCNFTTSNRRYIFYIFNIILKFLVFIYYFV